MPHTFTKHLPLALTTKLLFSDAKKKAVTPAQAGVYCFIVQITKSAEHNGYRPAPVWRVLILIALCALLFAVCLPNGQTALNFCLARYSCLISPVSYLLSHISCLISQKIPPDGGIFIRTGLLYMIPWGLPMSCNTHHETVVSWFWNTAVNAYTYCTLTFPTQM